MIIAAWRTHYNEGRPHSSLGNLTSSDYAAKLARGEVVPLPRRRSPRPAMGRSTPSREHSAARPIAPSPAVVHCQQPASR